MRYVAVISSQLHLNSLYTFLSMQEHIENDELRIYLIPKKDGSFLISRDDIEFDIPYSIEIVKYEEFSLLKSGFNFLKRLFFFNLVKLSQKEGNSVVCMFPDYQGIPLNELYRMQRDSKADNIFLVILEEGIGSYIRGASRWEERGLEQRNPLSKRVFLIRNSLRNRYGFNGLVKLFSDLGRLKYCCFFNRTDEGLKPNREFCGAFSEVLSKRSHKIEGVDYSNVILINSQRFFEELNSSIDIECYRIIQRICDRHGLRLVIKPHPREVKLDRYREFTLDESNKEASQEILLAGAEKKPLAIIGFFSTTLVTGELFFRIPPICLGKIENCGSLSGYKDDIASFIQTFRSVLIVPNSYKELEDVIMRLKNERLSE